MDQQFKGSNHTQLPKKRNASSPSGKQSQYRLSGSILSDWGAAIQCESNVSPWKRSSRVSTCRRGYQEHSSAQFGFNKRLHKHTTSSHMKYFLKAQSYVWVRGQKLKSDKRARNLHRRLRELKRSRECKVDGGHVSYSEKSPPGTDPGAASQHTGAERERWVPTSSVIPVWSSARRRKRREGRSADAGSEALIELLRCSSTIGGGPVMITHTSLHTTIFITASEYKRCFCQSVICHFVTGILFLSIHLSTLAPLKVCRISY